MTTWNYRLMARKYPNGEITVCMYNVYYDKDGIPSSYSYVQTYIEAEVEDGDKNQSLSIYQHFHEEMQRTVDAMDKPILWYGENFPNEYKPTHT